MHDFVIPELGRASPYGVYDLAANAAWVRIPLIPNTQSGRFRTPSPEFPNTCHVQVGAAATRDGERPRWVTSFSC